MNGDYVLVTRRRTIYDPNTGRYLTITVREIVFVPRPEPPRPAPVAYQPTYQPAGCATLLGVTGIFFVTLVGWGISLLF